MRRVLGEDEGEAGALDGWESQVVGNSSRSRSREEGVRGSGYISRVAGKALMGVDGLPVSWQREQTACDDVNGAGSAG